LAVTAAATEPPRAMVTAATAINRVRILIGRALLLGLRTGDGDERESALAEVSCVLQGIVNMYVYRLPTAIGRRQTACSSAVQADEVTR
jgi:hypothetical protein